MNYIFQTLYFCLSFSSLNLLPSDMITHARSANFFAHDSRNLDPKDINHHNIMRNIQTGRMSAARKACDLWANEVLYAHVDTKDKKVTQWFNTFFIPSIEKFDALYAKYYLQSLPSMYRLRGILRDIQANSELKDQLITIVRTYRNSEKFYTRFGRQSDIFIARSNTRLKISQLVQANFGSQLDAARPHTHFPVAFDNWLHVIIKKITNELPDRSNTVSYHKHL